MKNKFYISILLLVFLVLPVVVSAQTLGNRLRGKILLQVEAAGEAWYISPENEERYYLGRPADAFALMRELGLGVSNADFEKFGDYAPTRLAGKILLKVEDVGQAYYVNPVDLKMHFLGRPADAFAVMRNLGLGITNQNLSTIQIRAGHDIPKVVVGEEIEAVIPVVPPVIPDPVFPEDNVEPEIVIEDVDLPPGGVMIEELPVCEFTAEYFRNDTLAGYPILTRIENEINNEWWTGKPVGVNYSNEFSVRWTTECEFGEGAYKFTAVFDDAMRVKIDGELVINSWEKNFNELTLDADVYLEAGMHEIIVEYFEYKLNATAKFSWERL